MPLPDERPRQSVANLIGRFEQQGKRQPPPAVPLVPRSSSVSSQIAGDAAKEEVKEKREWPPKSVASTDNKLVPPTLSVAPSSSMAKPPVVSPQPIPDPTPPADTPSTPIPASPEPVKSPPSKGKTVATSKSTPSVGTRRAVASPKKSRSPITNSSSTKSLVSSPKALLQSSVSQPLRSQHTGHSVPSNPSTTRQPRPVPRTAPSTPSRPKSATSHHQAAARPKTPSSGLFAPTAASIARSRNAPPPPPPPVKKVTLSSDAAERLSKPTAASLSKARAPVVLVPSPVRMVKSTSTGAYPSTSRGSSKLKVGRTLVVKAKEVDVKEEVKSTASISSEPPDDSDHLVADRMENGHKLVAAALSDIGPPEDAHGPSEVLSEATHDPVPDKEVHPDPGPEVHSEQQAGEHPAADEAHDHEPVAESPPDEVVHEHEHPEAHEGAIPEPAESHEDAAPEPVEPHEDTVPEPAEPHADEVIGNGNAVNAEVAATGTDIEDMVNLLEGISFSKPRPQSMVTIPDEQGEIPDEY